MKNVNRILIVGAVSCFVWAIILTIAMYLDFDRSQKGSLHFESASPTITNSTKTGSTLNDFGTALSGTVGILITASGVLLLLVTVFQTQSELADTRNILTTQLVESTFFNLMKNHKEVIVDPVRTPLKNDIEKIIQLLSSYYASIYERRFLVADTTKWHPEGIYDFHPYFQNIGKSAMHIALHIETNVPQDKKHFYHQTFYYNLSDDEKFLFGMICENQLEPFGILSFGYSDYYLAHTKYKNSQETGYFPPIKIYCLQRLTQLLIPSYRILPDHTHLLKNSAFHIECDDSGVKLVRIRYFVKDRDKNATVSGGFEVDAETKDLSKMFLDTNLQTFIKGQGRVYINLEFVFVYKEKEYTICNSPVVLQVEHLDEEKWRARNEAYNVAVSFDVKEVIQFTISDADFLATFTGSTL